MHEHVLVRRQGQGTFMAGHSTPRFMFQFFHVEQQQIFGSKQHRASVQQPMEYPTIECLSFEHSSADRRVAHALGLQVDAATFSIENRVCLGGQPVMLDRLVVAAAAFKNLNKTDFTFLGKGIS